MPWQVAVDVFFIEIRSILFQNQGPDPVVAV
jgi:hypothetical protein